MAYTINKTSGAVLSTVSDGTVDTTTDLTLIGKNYAGYGEFLNENLIKLLENFANATAPSAPVAGQMWWDTAGSLLKVYTGTSFKTVSSSTASASTPSSSVTGDLWWDTTNGQLKVYNGSAFTTIGPAFTSGSGTSGAIVDTVTDSGSVDHVVVKMYANNTVVSTITKDATFTPQSAISGFATISPGMQISTSVSGAKLHGTATDADKLGGSAASAYLRVDQSDSTSGVFSILNDTGLVLGVDSDLTVGVSGSDVSIANASSDGDILFKVNDGGVVSTALTVDGATNRVLVAGDPTTSLGIASKAYVDAQLSASGDVKADGSVAIAGIIKPDANNTRDFGTAGLKFATIHATTFSGVSTSAQYADVAENFSADASYSPGTVVALGGAAEITRLNEELSDSVFGVISNKPAYLMNAGLEGGLPVAVSGRVPVRVIGMISKGERLVSAGDGLARSAHPGEANSFNVIGRALDSKTTIDEGVIEAFVTIN